ncbi:MAG: hypothetical protein QXI12_10360 [Candidatus Methanomethyliaceae archaeon]
MLGDKSTQRIPYLTYLVAGLTIISFVMHLCVSFSYIRNDEGGHIYDAALVIEGRIPFRDLKVTRAIPLLYFNAAMVRIFGTNIFIHKAVNAFLASMLGLVLFYIGRTLGGIGVGLLSLVLFNITPLSVLVPSIIGTILPEALMASLAIYIYVRTCFEASNRTWMWILSGFILALAVLIRVIAVVYVPLLTGILLITTPIRQWKTLLRQALMPFGMGILVPLLITFAYFAEQTSMGIRVLDPLLGLGVASQEQAALPLSYSFNNVKLMIRLNAVLLFTGFLAFLWFFLHLRSADVRTVRTFLLLIGWFAGLATIYLWYAPKRAFFLTYSFELVPPLIILGAIGIQRVILQSSLKRPFLLRGILGVSAVVLAFYSSFWLKIRPFPSDAELQAGVVPFQAILGTGISPSTLERVSCYIRAHTSPTDTILAGSMYWPSQSGRRQMLNLSHPLLYEKGSKRYLGYNAPSPEEIVQYVREHPPVYIIRDAHFDLTFNNFLRDVVASMYHLEETIDEVRIYRVLTSKVNVVTEQPTTSAFSASNDKMPDSWTGKHVPSPSNCKIVLDTSVKIEGVGSYKVEKADTNTSNCFVYKKVLSTDSYHRVQMWLRFNELPASNSSFLGLTTDSVSQQSLILRPDGKLQVRNSVKGTNYAANDMAPLSVNSWYEISLIIYYHHTDGYITLKVNASTVLHVSNIDTLKGETYPNWLRVGHLSTNNAGYDIWFDHVRWEWGTKESEFIDPTTLRSKTTLLPFGVQIPDQVPDTVGSRKILSRLADLGVSWGRLNLYWDKIEPRRTVPPTYEWDDTDKVLRTIAPAKLNLILTVRNNPSWAAETPCGPLNEIGLEGLAEFLSTAVKRYSQPPYYIKYWELYNEPDVKPSKSFLQHGGCWGHDSKAYAKMLRIAYEAIKNADPGAQVLIGGIAYEDFDTNVFAPHFLDDVLDSEGSRYFDILNFHYYPAFADVWNRYGTDVIGKASYLRAEMERRGLLKPLIITEIGLPTAGPAEDKQSYSDELTARYVVQAMARAASTNLQAAIWFTLIDNPRDARKYGLLQSDGTPKPAYNAYRVLTRVLSEARFQSTIAAKRGMGLSYPDELEGYVFLNTNSQEEYWVVWSNDGKKHTLSMNVRRLGCISLYGEKKWLDDGGNGDVDGVPDGKVTVEVVADPVYLIVSLG